MEFIDQVQRLAESLTFCLKTLPETISIHEAVDNNAFKQLLEICKTPSSPLKLDDKVLQDASGVFKTVENDNVKDESEDSFHEISNENSKAEKLNSLDLDQLVKLEIDRLKNESKVKKSREQKPYLKPYQLYDYHCIFCEKYFETVEHQHNHDQEMHMKESRYLCPNCNSTFDSKIELVQHYSDNHHSNSLIKFCYKCKEPFFKAVDLRKHINDLHGESLPMEKCLMCEESFKTDKRAIFHMDTVHAYLKFRCSKFLSCGKIFDSFIDWKLHKETHVLPDFMTCQECGKEFSKAENAKYQRHVKSHSMEKSISCSQCEEMFYFEIELRWHITNKHDLQHKCSECDYKANYQSTLKKHFIAIHTNEKSHICAKCGMSFKRKSNLWNHSFIHADRIFKCEVCGSSFKKQKYLTDHVRIHSSDYQAQCALCGKNFIQKSNWKQHMKKHHPDN